MLHAMTVKYEFGPMFGIFGEHTVFLQMARLAGQLWSPFSHSSVSCDAPQLVLQALHLEKVRERAK
jgi:hypothetical protein